MVCGILIITNSQQKFYFYDDNNSWNVDSFFDVWTESSAPSPDHHDLDSDNDGIPTVKLLYMIDCVNIIKIDHIFFMF
jgi:hypothetical protein